MKFRENLLDGIEVIERTRFSLEKNQRGIGPQSCRRCYLFFAQHLIAVYICNKQHNDIVDSFTVMESTRVTFEQFQSSIIPEKL